MGLRLAADCLQQFSHIQLVGSECAEGIILVDPAQSIIWANRAALDMHHIGETAELGETIDEYHAKFQVKYLSVLADPAGGLRQATPEGSSRSQPEVLMEFKPQPESAQASVYRTRKMVLLDKTGRPGCIVFIIHRFTESACAPDKIAELVGLFSMPAAILRREDESFVAGNPAFLALCQDAGLSQPGSAPQPGAGARTDLEIDGRTYVLVTYGDAGALAETQLFEKAADTARGLAVLQQVAMYTADAAGRIVEVNQVWLDWLGYGRAEVIGRQIADFMTTVSAPHFERQAQTQLAETGNMQEIPAEFIMKSGGVAFALVSAVATGGGHPPPLAAICIDVTARRRAEESLSAMFARAPVPMLVRKFEDGRITDANEAFLKATGFSAADVVGHGFDEFGIFETRKHKDEFDAKLRADGLAEAVDISLKTAHGDTLDCVLSTSKVWMAGKPCILVVLQDVSERRRTEAELMSALEAVMADKSWFSRSVVERLAALRAPPKPGRRIAALGDLTPRERDVLSLISLGMSDAEIAARLSLTRSTIRNHLSTLYSKINVKNRGGAIIWARERCINITQMPVRVKSAQAKFGSGNQTAQQIVPLAQSVPPAAHGKISACRIEPVLKACGPNRPV
jgi:PAS domain S-box-containing protein